MKRVHAFFCFMAIVPEGNMTRNTYDVGFGKPPKSSQFKKGKSGNPKGRPPGSRNFASVLEAALRETVVIKEEGIPKTVSKLEAGCKRITDKFVSGDPKIVRLVASVCWSDNQMPEAHGRDAFSNELELRVFESFLKRLEVTSRQEAEDESDPVSE